MGDGPADAPLPSSCAADQVGSRVADAAKLCSRQLVSLGVGDCRAA